MSTKDIIEKTMEQDTSEEMVVEETPQEETPVETPPEKTPETNEETPSFLAEVEEPTKEKERVPLADLMKERRKRQDAESRLKELEQAKQTPVDLSGLLDDPSDLVDGNTALKIAEQVRQQTLQEIEQREATKEEQTLIQQRQSTIRKSENAARQQFNDYDAVVSKAIGYMTPDELTAIRRTPNPGAVLYRKSKEVLNLMEIQPAPVAETPEPEETPPDEVEAEDEEIYTSVFGGSSG